MRRKSARMYATQGPSTIGWGVAVDQQGWNATYAGMAKMLLRSFTNNLDHSGADYIAEPGPVINGKFPVRDSELELADRVSPEARKKLVGGDVHRFMGWERTRPMSVSSTFARMISRSESTSPGSPAFARSSFIRSSTRRTAGCVAAKGSNLPESTLSPAAP